MSETSYERGYRHGTEGTSVGTESRRNSGNFLTRKLGPAPMWAWIAVATILALVVYLWRKNSQSNTGSGTTDTSQIPEFVNQVYTQVTPPGDGNNGPPKPSEPTKTPTTGEIASNHLTPISMEQAKTLLSHKQRPYTWDGTAFTAATKIQKGVQYYAGELEIEEIYSKSGPFGGTKKGNHPFSGVGNPRIGKGDLGRPPGK